MISVNLSGAVACVHAAVPYMKQRGGGSIVFVASIAGELGSYAAPVCGATKAGLVGLAKGLAKQLGRYKIRVNCVSPGSVEWHPAARQSQGIPFDPH